jgi:hypothetical protein
LIHDAAWRADYEILNLLAKESDFLRLDGKVECSTDRLHGGHLEGGRRTDTFTWRNSRLDQNSRALGE